MINSMLIFALIVIIIFYFAFSVLVEDSGLTIENGGKFIDYLSAGILWIAFIFTGILGLSRSFIAEKDKNCLEGLMLCPVSRNTIYLGKVISNLVLIFLIEIVTILFFALFFNYDFNDKIFLLIPILILGTFGFVIVGALLSAISISTRNREVMLPLLLFPILIPVIISAVTATGDVMVGASLGDISDNLKLLGSYDLIFLVIGLMTFEYVIED
jgi:heme exporter protein B